MLSPTRAAPFFDHEVACGPGHEVSGAREIISRIPESSGCVITFDAAHTNRKTAIQVVGKKDLDYMMQVKGNTPDLEEFIKRKLARSPNGQTVTVNSCGHGRIETRTLEIIPTTPAEANWPHAHTICRVTRSREVLRGGKVIDSNNGTQSLYVASFPSARYSPQEVLQLSRGHWHIENGLHHRKDRSMDEDRNRAVGRGYGRIVCALRSVIAGIFGRAREDLKVIYRRLSAKPGLLVKLLFSSSLNDWEKRYSPYSLR